MTIITSIRNCTKCHLSAIQKPLIGYQSNADIMWVGISAKRNLHTEEFPLDPRTLTGQIIATIEESFPQVSFYATNIVKCAPIDTITNTLRYPRQDELDACYENFTIEKNALHPSCIVLLGNIVSQTVQKATGLKMVELPKNNYHYTATIESKTGISYLPIHHPSYIGVYKKKDLLHYIQGVQESLMRTLQ